MMDTSPLVSCVLLTYNQEKYVLDSLNSVLSQDYENLQVIVSDDGSKDETLKIVQDRVGAYKGGKRVVVMHNQENMGLASNYNLAMAAAEGEFIVYCCGDDISVPDRVSTLVNAWLSSKRRTKLFHSAYKPFVGEPAAADPVVESSQNGLSDLNVCVRTNAYVMGATQAFDRDIWDVFGPLGVEVVHEDSATATRALMLGEIGYVDEALVHYRLGGVTAVGISQWKPSDYYSFKATKFISRQVVDYQQKILDLKVVVPAGADKLLDVCLAKKEKLEIQKGVCEGSISTMGLWTLWRNKLISLSQMFNMICAIKIPMLYNLRIRLHQSILRSVNNI